MRLLAKFSLIFVLVFGLGLGASAYIFYGVLQRNAREQVLYTAQLMMETALAMRSYTISQVRPALADNSDVQQRAQKAEEKSDDVFRELCAKRGFIAKWRSTRAWPRRARAARSSPARSFVASPSATSASRW